MKINILLFLLIIERIAIIIMYIADRTKSSFANALLELTNKKPLSDISISDITAFCNVSRNSFYYHFKDKQDLIYWIYETFHDSKINLSMNDGHANTIELLKYMQNYLSFFKQAFSENGQNCFKKEFYNSFYKDYLYIIDSNYETTGINSDAKEFLAKYFAHSSVGMFELFLNSPPQDTENLIRIYTLILKNGLEGTLESLKRLELL